MPNCSAEIMVLFGPQEAQVYERAVYCDISGAAPPPASLTAVRARCKHCPHPWAPVESLGRLRAQQGSAGTSPLSLQLPGDLLYFDFSPLSCSEGCLYLVCSSSLGKNTL